MIVTTIKSAGLRSFGVANVSLVPFIIQVVVIARWYKDSEIIWNIF